MKVFFIDKRTNKGVLFSCKSELAKHLNVSYPTVQNWCNRGELKQTDKFLICFDIEERKNKKLRRNTVF